MSPKFGSLKFNVRLVFHSFSGNCSAKGSEEKGSHPPKCTVFVEAPFLVWTWWHGSNKFAKSNDTSCLLIYTLLLEGLEGKK